VQQREQVPARGAARLFAPQLRAANTGTHELQGIAQVLPVAGIEEAACRESRLTAAPASSRCSRSSTAQAASRTSNGTTSGILQSARVLRHSRSVLTLAVRQVFGIHTEMVDLV